MMMMMMKANTASLIHYSVAIAFIFLTHHSAIAIQNKPKSTHDESSSSPSSNSTTSNATRTIILKNNNEFHPQRTKLSPIHVYDVYTSEMRNNTSGAKKTVLFSQSNHHSNSQKSLRSTTTLTPVANPNITKISAIAAPSLKLPDSGTRGDEVLTVSSSGGDNDVKDKGGGANTDDEEQKSLSEQVSDGKYALIQNEIFTSPPRRPGLLSYDVNPEVPKDNVNNLGGLDPDDIWLAENHLLVLAGNSLGANQHKWRPIDDYIAPKRPVQLPPNPRVPPPFPVQLTEDGPAQYIGNSLPPANPFSFFNPVLSMQYPTFGNKTSTTLYNQPNNSPSSPYNKTPYGGGYGGNNNNINPKPPSFFNHPANLPSPLSPAQQPKPPPGAEFIPTYLGVNNNQSDAFDEDDPSLYYPPPYDFYYPQQNNSRVPAGPLVPGIVLPPPPNFFTQLGGAGLTSSAPEHPKTSAFKERPPPSSKYIQTTYKSGKKLLQPPVVVAQNHHEITPLFPVGKPVPTQFNTQDKPSYRQQYSDTLGNEIPSNIPPVDDDDNSLVRGVHLNTIPQNATGDNEWIPIPAPQPYYITGPRKPNTNKLLVMMESPPLNYHYKQAAAPPGASSQSLSAPTKKRPKQPSVKFLQYVDDVQQNYPSTTPLVSQIVSTPEPPTTTAPSTTPIASHHHQPTIKATYYFYEEPNYIDVDHSTRRPPQRLTTEAPSPAVTSTYPPNYPTSTLTSRRRKPAATPPMLPMYYLAGLDNSLDYQNPTTLATPAAVPLIQTTIRPSYKPAISGASYDVEESPPIRNYNREPTSKPLSPLSQFLDDNYENESPSSSPPPPPSINHYNNKPTPKPISEFSYVASNYEDPVRVVQVQSTAKPPSNDLPPHYHIRYNTFYRPAAPQSGAGAAAISYPMLDAIELINKQAPATAAQTTPAPPPAYLFLNHFNHQQQSYIPQRPRLRPQYQIQLPIQQSPQYQLPAAAQSPQPWLAVANAYNGGGYQPSSYTTENPYYAFFTKEDEELIDENTKKYFSLFGQKLNHPTDDEAAAAATGSAGGNGAILEATSPLPPAVSTPGSRWKPLVSYYPSQSVTSTTPSAKAVALIQSTTTPSTLQLLGQQQPSSESSSQYPPPSNFIRRPFPPRDSPVNYVTITSPSSTPPLDTSLSSSANDDSDFVPSKHIRPIIVSDLPRDLHERLRNIQQLDSAVAAAGGHGHRVRPRPSYPTNSRDSSIRQSQADEHYSSAQSSRKPVSLHSDTRVNYIRGGRGGSSSSGNLRTNPDAEYIGGTTSDENQSSEERHQGVETRGGDHQKGAPISLHDDILVNYKWGPHLTALNPDAEFIDPRGREAPNGGTGGRGSGSSTSQNVIPYNEYRQSPSLDRGHFYFLTPPLSSTANRPRQRNTAPARSKQSSPAYENTRHVDEGDDARDEERRDVDGGYDDDDDDKDAPRRGPGISRYQKRHGSDEQRQGRRGKEASVSSTESRDS